MRFTLKTWMGVLVGLWLSASAGAATFTATLDREEVTLGEGATLSLTFEGGSPRSVPTPSVSGLQIVQIGNSQNFSIVNGAMSSTVTITFSVRPQHDGDFTIPALTAQVAGQQLTTEPLKFRASKAAAPSADAINSGNEVAFLKLNFAREKMFTGESAVMRLDLYLRDEVQNFGNVQFTGSSPDGFSVGKAVELPSQRRRVQLGNRSFTVIPYSLPLTAVKTGPYPLGPFTANLVIVLPGGFFGEQRQIAVTTEARNLETLPLPTLNRPSNFTGAIGDFTMTATAGPTALTVGDPVTVRVQISGHGSLDTVTLPAQDSWRDFKTYPPTAKLETSDPLGLRGRKSFEQIVSPLNSDVHELPPLTFSFFNPDDGQYHTLTEPAVPLTVRNAEAYPLPALAGKNPSPEAPPPPDILPLKEKLGELETLPAPLVARPAFLAAQTLPVLALLAAFICRQRADRLANNPRLRRQRAVAQLVNGGLSDLNKFAAENKSDDFFAMLFRLLQEQLGERLDCPATAITEADVDQRLTRLGASPATQQSLRELFQLCNQARYAPIQTRQELAAIALKFKKTSGELQSLKP
jgi:hypothetical protein